MPTVNQYGAYSLTGATSERGYHGRFRNQSVMIVGYGTEHERLFLVPQRQEAKAHAKEHNLRIIRAIANQIPEDLGVELFGE
jgi:hypothetical protein